MDFKQAKELMKIQEEFSKLQEELESIHIEAESEWLVLVIDATNNIKNIYFENNNLTENKELQEKLQKVIIEVFEKAIKKSKEISQEKLKIILEKSHFNLPNKKNNNQA